MKTWLTIQIFLTLSGIALAYTPAEIATESVKNTPNTEADCTDSINRYIVMPSQATAYKIGMLKILELREKAKQSLGDKFDIHQFHEVVLSNGSVPLDVLEELVDRWIKSRQAG
jgi:uncharacterized protein (DUF885 family)